MVDAAAAFSGAEAPPEQRGVVLGRLQSAVAAGSLVGPLIGGILIRIWGFRPLLLTMGVLTGMCAIAACFFLQESQHPPSVSTTQISITRTFKTLLREPKTRAFILAGICAKVGIFGLVTVFAPFVKELVNAPTSTAAAMWVGLLQAVTWSATFIGSGWWGKQNDRKSVEWNYIFASLLCGVSVILQGLVHQIEWVFVLRVLQGFCFSALDQSVFLMVVKSSTQENQGVRIGATNSYLTLGQIFGSFSGGILASLLNIEGIFLAIGSVFALGSCLVGLSVKPIHITKFGK